MLDFVQSPAQGLSLRLPIRQRLRVRGAFVDRPDPHCLPRQQRRKKRPQPKVVLLQNWIELVIVTPRALYAHAEEHIRRHVGHIVEDVAPLQLHVALVVLVNPVAQKHRRRVSLALARRNLITRQLLVNEPRVRFVGIEGSDDIIAIPPSLRPERIRAKAVRIRIAHKVQPERRLPLAIPRTRQQPVHDFFICTCRRVFKKIRNLFRRRRQPCKVKRHPPNQLPFPRRPNRLQPLSGMLSGNKLVDIISRPASTRRWNGRLFNRLKRPPSKLILGELGCRQRKNARENQNYSVPVHGAFLPSERDSGEKIIGARPTARRPATRLCRGRPGRVPKSSRRRSRHARRALFCGEWLRGR